MRVTPIAGSRLVTAILAVVLGTLMCVKSEASDLIFSESAGPAAAADGDPTGDVLHDLVDQQQGEIEQLRRRLDAVESRASHANASRHRFGYDQGFFASSPDGIRLGDQTAPYLLKLNSWLQLRHTVFDSKGTTADQNDIEFERLRIVLSGHVYTPDLTFFTQIDGDSDQGEFADWLDYFVRYDIGHDALGLNRNHLRIRAGKWKLPFNRTRAESGWKLQFADRSVASSFFDINRSLGASLQGQTMIRETPLAWEAAVFNGFNTQGFLPVRAAQLDRNLATSARFTIDLLGEWGRDGEPDLAQHKNPAIRAGGGFAYSRVDAEGPREFASIRVVDSGAILATILPPNIDAFNVFLYATDLNLKWRGLSILSEMYFRQINQFSGGRVADLFDHGFLVQSGYFICPKKLELIGRWSRIVGDSGTLGDRPQSTDEVAGGVVWYIRGHLAKLTFDVTRVNGTPIRDPALNLLPGDDGILYRTQFQLRF